MLKVSVVVPFHWMKSWPFFLERCLKSIEKQTYKNYEIVLVKHSTMPVTSNRAIQSASGDIIKILYMDDYLYDENALQHLVDNWKGGWAVSGCVHDNGEMILNPHFPKWNSDVPNGVNTIGSPSVLALENDETLFDENLSWLLDCELYGRLYAKYGEPTIVNYTDVAIGLHDGQMTHLMSDEVKLSEHQYVQQKYGNTTA